MAKFDDEQLSFVGGESLGWPKMGEPECGQVWRHAHRAVEAMRDVLRGSDDKLGAIEANRDLAEHGRTRQLAEIGLDTIRRIDEVAPLNTARVRIGEEIAALDGQMQAHAKLPEAPADIALAGEIRSALRGMSPGERMRFIGANLDRPGLAGAVSGDASYLAGLSETEAAEVRTLIAERLYAPQAAEKAKLQGALRVLDVAVTRAHSLVASRARVERNHHGDWAPKSVGAPGGPVARGQDLPPGTFMTTGR